MLPAIMVLCMQLFMLLLLLIADMQGTYKGPIRMTVACYTTPGDTGASPATAMAIDATADTVEDFTASIAGTATGASATANVPSAQPHLHHNSTRQVIF